MRKRLLLAVVALSLLFVSPVDAQTDIERARTDVAQATERLEDLLADLEETQRRGDTLAGNYWQVQSGVEKLDLEIQSSELVAANLQVQSNELRQEVKIIAVDQYVSRSNNFATGDHESEADRAAAEALARLVIGADNNALDQLAAINESQDELRTKLEDQRIEQTEQLAEVQATQSTIAEELERLAQLQAALASELDGLNGALDALEKAEADRQAAAAEAELIAQERQRAEAAAAAAASLARRVPTPSPVSPTPAPTATEVPNPQPAEPAADEPLPSAVPNPQPSEPLATAVPNPQPSEPQPAEPLATAVPNPQPSEPQPAEPLATAVPNPQPAEPLATAVPNPQPSEPLATPVPAPIAPAPGAIVCPLAGPFTHTDDFNAPRQVGGVHRANDLISAQGTPVIAAAAGSIDHRDSSVGGLSAHLKGDNGDYYFYTHLSGYENVGAGHVAAGTIIGYVGMTGNAPIPHLHFEIHKGGYGNYSNPYGPVRAACF